MLRSSQYVLPRLASKFLIHRSLECIITYPMSWNSSDSHHNHLSIDRAPIWLTYSIRQQNMAPFTSLLRSRLILCPFLAPKRHPNGYRWCSGRVLAGRRRLETKTSAVISRLHYRTCAEPHSSWKQNRNWSRRRDRNAKKKRHSKHPKVDGEEQASDIQLPPPIHQDTLTHPISPDQSQIIANTTDKLHHLVPDNSENPQAPTTSNPTALVGQRDWTAASFPRYLQIQT